MSKMQHKGQAFSLDFILAAIIFFAILGSFYFVWDTAQKRSISLQDQQALELTALGIADILVMQKGVPESWNATTVTSLGLAHNPRVLDSSKVSMFYNLSSDKISSIFGLSTSSLGVRFRELNGTTFLTRGSFGGSPSVSVSRIVRYENRTVRLEVSVS